MDEHGRGKFFRIYTVAIPPFIRAKWITANGHTYKKDAVVLTGVSRDPIFGKITAIYLVNEQEVALQVRSEDSGN